MTWKQFRQRIDAKLREGGISEDVEIDYIDVSKNLIHENSLENCEIYYDKDGLAIH